MSDANIYYSNDSSMAASALFHQPNQNMQDYIAGTINTYVNAIKSTVPDFASAVQQRYNAICNSDTIRYIGNLKNRINSLWDPNTIRHLTTLNAVQQAPEVMRRYVLAHPILRNLHLTNGISAYDNFVKPDYQTGVGKKHYDYRRVTDGVLLRAGDGSVGYSIFKENILSPTDILSIVSKGSILATWETIDYHFDNERLEDPTSVWNANL